MTDPEEKTVTVPHNTVLTDDIHVLIEDIPVLIEDIPDALVTAVPTNPQSDLIQFWGY